MYEAKMSESEYLLEKFMTHWERYVKSGKEAPMRVYDRKIIGMFTDWIVANYTLTQKTPPRKVVT